MKVITKAIEKDFSRYPLYSQDGKGKSAHVIVKLFCPFHAGTWYVLEGSKQPDGDYEMFVLYTCGREKEYGYQLLSELFRTFGRWLERDMYFSGTVADALKDAGIE